jgi:hypothetical protein
LSAAAVTGTTDLLHHPVAEMRLVAPVIDEQHQEPGDSRPELLLLLRQPLQPANASVKIASNSASGRCAALRTRSA